MLCELQGWELSLKMNNLQLICQCSWKHFRNGNVLFSFYYLNWVGPALDLGAWRVLQQASQQFAVLSVGRIKTSLWMAEISSISSCWTFSCECSGAWSSSHNTIPILFPCALMQLSCSAGLGVRTRKRQGWLITATCLPFGGFRAFFAKISDAFPLTLVCETSL